MSGPCIAPMRKSSTFAGVELPPAAGPTGYDSRLADAVIQDASERGMVGPADIARLEKLRNVDRTAFSKEVEDVSARTNFRVCTKVLIEEAADRFNLIDTRRKQALLNLHETDFASCAAQVAKLGLASDTKRAYALRYTMVSAMNFGVVAEDGSIIDRNAFLAFNKKPLSARQDYVRENRLDEVCSAHLLLVAALQRGIIREVEKHRLTQLRPRELVLALSERSLLEKLGKHVDELDARENAGRAKRDADPGFVMLFNGKDFNGWAGAVSEFEVANGSMRCKPNQGGVIFSREQFEDFVLKFDFKLSPGGNNGVAVRYPGAGDPAYHGMCEVQILDNPKGKNLDPTQYCGSVYGMAAAKYPADLLKPPGEWNTEVVTVRGSNVRVELNGKLILDSDVSRIDTFLTGTPHPGRDLKQGHIGFAGHSDPVEIGNIQVKRLD